MTNYIFEKHQRLLALMEAAMTMRLIPALMDPPSERPAGLQKDFSCFYGASRNVTRRGPSGLSPSLGRLSLINHPSRLFGMISTGGQQ